MHLIHFGRLEKKDHLIKCRFKIVNNVKRFVETEAARSVGLNWLEI
jgi:hypothetical protein